MKDNSIKYGGGQEITITANTTIKLCTEDVGQYFFFGDIFIEICTFVS